MEIIRKENSKELGTVKVGEVFEIIDFEEFGVFLVLTDCVLNLNENDLIWWDEFYEDLSAHISIDNLDKTPVRLFEATLTLNR